MPEAAGWSKFTLKAELAFKKPYDFSRYTGPDINSTHRPPGQYFQYVTGFDRSFAGVFWDKDELVLTLEYAGEQGPKDAAALLRPFDSDVAARIAWSARGFARTKVEARGVVDVRNGEVIAEAFVSRQLRLIHDDLKLELGGRYLRPASAEATLLAAFPQNNSRLHARAQFDF